MARDRETFFATMGELGMCDAHIRALLRWSATHNRLQVEECNRELTAKEQRKEKRAEEVIATICRNYQIRPVFGGDPRGHTVKLLLPNGKYNTWGGAECGWGVPTS